MTHDLEAIDQALRRLSMRDRLAALVMSVIADNPGAVTAVVSLIKVAATMANHLSPEQRRALAHHMVTEAHQVDPRSWN